jgi:outer membrane receptor protein involved in Fe transport
MTAKPRKRFVQAAVAAAAALAFVVLACDMPLPLQDDAEPTPGLHQAASDESPPSTITVVADGDEAEPILYIDGVRVYEAIDVVLDTLPRDGIDRVEVVKGETATAEYGEDAADGVIHIYLKTVTQAEGNDTPEG